MYLVASRAIKPDRFPLYYYFAVPCGAIKLLDVEIPPHAIRGQDTKLRCIYDMEGDKLYSIKWYRNGHEFYRYIPSDNPKTTIFNGNGINVDVSVQVVYLVVHYRLFL